MVCGSQYWVVAFTTSWPWFQPHREPMEYNDLQVVKNEANKWCRISACSRISLAAGDSPGVSPVDWFYAGPYPAGSKSKWRSSWLLKCIEMTIWTFSFVISGNKWLHNIKLFSWLSLNVLLTLYFTSMNWPIDLWIGLCIICMSKIIATLLIVIISWFIIFVNNYRVEKSR